MKKKVQITCFILALAVAATVTVFAASGYDSSNDPLVSLSYITGVFKPQIDAEIGALETEIGTLETEIGALEGEIDSLKDKIDSLEETIDELESNPPTVTPGTTPSVTPGPTSGGSATSEPTEDTLPEINGYTYEIIFLEQGDVLFATTPCDVILRSGSAKVISPFIEEGLLQGINDYTTGDELLNGDDVSINHFLLIPRGNDGRGIVITSSYGSYVIVRGGYAVVEAGE